MSGIESFNRNTLERRTVLPIAVGALILAASLVALMFLVQNRIPVVVLTVSSSIGMLAFSGHLDEFYYPDPESARTAGSRKRRLIGAVLWSSFIGAFFNRMVNEPGAVCLSAWAFLFGFGCAMLFTLPWTLDPVGFMAFGAEIVDKQFTFKRSRSSGMREERETDESSGSQRWRENAKERRREMIKIGRLYAEEELEIEEEVGSPVIFEANRLMENLCQFRRRDASAE